MLETPHFISPPLVHANHTMTLGFKGIEIIVGIGMYYIAIMRLKEC
jgi:hypothetical protein